MIGVVRLRRGERLVLAEYPKGFMERLNARLDELALIEEETSEACS